MPGSGPYSLGDATVLLETSKAILVNRDGVEIWIPKIVLHDDSEVWSEKNSEGEVIVKEWWAEANGFA